MRRYNRLGLTIIMVMLLAAVWLNFGLLAALGVSFATGGYFLVLAMRMAADEIKRYERDQRPDLHAFDR
jgi:uncharacterized membrane protein